MTIALNRSTRMFGLERLGIEELEMLQTAYQDYHFLDASSADALAPTGDTDFFQNCKGISCDSDGIIKIDFMTDFGATKTEVLTIYAGSIRPVRNVIKLYRYYTGTTAGTAGSYNSSGSLITNAIKLHR